jgi:hypothetical protein
MAMQILQVFGRRWFNRSCGNTYHSATIYVDGDCVHKIDFAYGYGNHYEETSLQWLEKNGYLPGLIHHRNGSHEGLWRYCERNGIKYRQDVTDVQRKKDL